MKKPDKQPMHYMLFGNLLPGADTASAVIQLACSLSRRARVTVVISDQAPEPQKMENAPFRIIRERAFPEEANKDAAQRIYLLGNNYQSLWALRMYHLYGGSVLPVGYTLAGLHRSFCETLPGWPSEYTDWLEKSFGSAGAEIAHALIHHRRESDTFTQDVLIGVQKATAQHAAFVTNEDILPANLPVCDILPPADQGKKLQAKSLPGTKNTTHHTSLQGMQTVLILIDPAHSYSLDEVLELDSETLPVFHPDTITGCEPDLGHRIKSADILLVLSQKQAMPPAVLIALSQATPIITCNQRWVHTLPAQTGFNVPSPTARHALKAALGGLLANPELWQWASEQANSLYELINYPDWYRDFEKTLKTISCAPVKPQSGTQPAKQSASAKQACKNTSKPDVRFKAPAKQTAFALIGAVPPKPLLEEFFPFIDREKSPRFATEDILTSLYGTDDGYALSKVALFGYESPILDKNGQDWNTLKPELRAAKEAICFGVDIEGAIPATSFTPAEAINGFQLALDFKDIKDPKTLACHNQASGLFWQRDTIEQGIEAILITGWSGLYTCKIEKSDLALVLTQPDRTELLTAHQPVQLKATDNGILKFQVSVYDSPIMNQLADTLLVEALADLTLTIEWLGYGE